MKFSNKSNFYNFLRDYSLKVFNNILLIQDIYADIC